MKSTDVLRRHDVQKEEVYPLKAVSQSDMAVLVEMNSFGDGSGAQVMSACCS